MNIIGGIIIVNRKILGLILLGILSVSTVGCSSDENTSEPVKGQNFTITDGESYEDIETLENNSVYVIPSGKWKITKLEDGDLGINK